MKSFKKYNTLEVLIPTLNSNVNDLDGLFSYWNIQTDCVISNQCNHTSTRTLYFRGHRIRWYDIDSRGVSTNRNNLLNHLDADIGLFIDDDCSLIDGYEMIVLEEMNAFSAEAALFTGFNVKGDILNSRKKTIICKRYRDISHIGGPGICVSSDFIRQNNLFFNEKLGTPNYIYLGEDSLFGFEMIKTKKRVLHSNKPVFRIKEDVDNSTYFRGYDEQFFYSRGAINKLVHPRFFVLWRFYYSARLSKKTKQGFFYISNMMKKGEKAIKKGLIL